MMRLLITIMLGMSSLTLAYLDTSMYSRDINGVDWSLLWRRSGQPPPRPGKLSGPQPRGAFSGSVLKTNSKPTISDPLKQQRTQPGSSRLSADIPFAQPSRGSDRSSSLSKSAQAQGRLHSPESVQLGMGKERGRIRAGSASSGGSNNPGDQEMQPAIKSDYVRKLENRPVIQMDHLRMMQSAGNSVNQANERSMPRLSQGKREPDRPAEKYQALKDAKVEVRRAHKDANQKIRAAGQALHRGPAAMDPAIQQKLDLADEAVYKTDRISREYQDAHVEAAASAVQQGRWSDFADHVKKDVKMVSRINASKAYLGAVNAAQQDKHNIEQLSKIDRSDPRREAAVDRAIASRIDSKAAKQFSSFQHRLYRDARQRFADSSSSEDEMETFD